MQSCREMVQFYRWLSAFMYQRLHSRWRAVHRSRMVFGGYHFDIVLLWFWISVINSFSDGMSLAPIEQSAILSGGPGIVWLIFPTYLSSTPVGFGIHPGKWSCTHSHWPFSATPPSLWPGRELRKFHCSVPGEWCSVFKVRFLASGFFPSGILPLAVTIVYRKITSILRNW